MRWFALLLFLVPGTAAALTASGVVIRHGFTASFGPQTPPREASSNQTLVTVKSLSDPGIAPARALSTPAGQPVDFVHTVTNRGNSPDSFLLQASTPLANISEPGTSTSLRFFASAGAAATYSCRDAKARPGQKLTYVLYALGFDGSRQRCGPFVVRAGGR